MESFVPFGGFFSAPSDLKFPLSNTFQCPPRSLQRSDNCEQDQVSDVSKGGFTSSVTEQCQSSLPSWLQMAALSANKGGLDVKVCLTFKVYLISLVSPLDFSPSSISISTYI